MQIRTKENGNLVEVNAGSNHPGFKLTRLYCTCSGKFKDLAVKDMHETTVLQN